MEMVKKVVEHFRGIPLTKWLKAKVKPKHHGWYEVKYAGREATVMYYWTGRRWMYEVQKSKGRTGLAPSFSFGLAKGDRWRGLSEEYKEAIEAVAVPQNVETPVAEA